MIATERHLLGRAAGRRHEGTALAGPGDVTVAILDAGLSAEQGALVRQVCLSGAGVDVIEGVAGSGKTTALAAAAKAWTASGITVRGCALAARAAAGLQDATGIPSTTLDRLLRRRPQPRAA
jgi:hypothetical protein